MDTWIVSNLGLLCPGNEAAAPSTAATGHGGPAVLGGAVSSLDLDPRWGLFSGQSVSSHCLWPLKHSTANAQPGGPELRKGQQFEITVGFPGGSDGKEST